MPTEASTLCRLRRHAPVGACLWIAPADAGYEGLLSLRQGNHRILGRGFSHPAGSTRSNCTKFVNVGQVMEDDNVKVTSVVVQHPPVTAAFGFDSTLPTDRLHSPVTRLRWRPWRRWPKAPMFWSTKRS